MLPRRCRPVLILTLISFASPAIAGPTERACLRSDRSPGREVCACAQALADRLLSARDQQQAARIIADPDLFQIIRRRTNPAAEAFIERYRTWGDLTQRSCG